MEVSLAGNLYDKNFNLNCVSKIITGNRKKFKPYNILENNNIVGQLYQTDISNII